VDQIQCGGEGQKPKQARNKQTNGRGRRLAELTDGCCSEGDSQGFYYLYFIPLFLEIPTISFHLLYSRTNKRTNKGVSGAHLQSCSTVAKVMCAISRNLLKLDGVAK